MSQLKLKHSGGNSVSLNPPTSAPTSSDVAFKLPNADGTAGQVLKTDASGNLGWTSNNSMTLLSNTSLSSSGSVIANVTGLDLSDYKILYGQMYGIARSGGGDIGDVPMRFNGSSSNIYKYVMNRMDNAGNHSVIGHNSQNGFYYNMTGVAGYSSTINFAHFTLHLPNSGTRKTFNMNAGGELNGSAIVLLTNGFWDNTSAVTSLEVQCSVSDINAGTLKLYGVK